MPDDDTRSRLHTRPSLLLRIRDSADTEAWRQFADLYARVIYGYCRRRGLQDADAADVTQEVLAQVARSIRSFEYSPERGRFRGWLGAVTHSKIERFRRTASRSDGGATTESAARASDPPIEDVESDGADPEWIDEFNAEVLRAAMERVRPEFEPQTWRAFELTWLENRTPQDAAREIGCRIHAIYVSKSRVLSRLRDEVAAIAEDLPQFVPLA
jgi:RNA polymerase sigma-70 factor (ECF subfamily)